MESQAANKAQRLPAVREKHKTRRGRKQAVRQARLHQEEPGLVADGPPSSEPWPPQTQKTGIHKLPRELTNMIWQHVGDWPTKESLAGEAVKTLDEGEEGRRPILTQTIEVAVPGPDGDSVEEEEVEIWLSAIYTLAPPALAQVCRETRAFSLEQFGLLQSADGSSSNKANRKNNKRRWAHDYIVPMLAQPLVSDWDPTRKLPLRVSDILHVDGPQHKQMVLDLDELRHDQYGSEFGKKPDPLGRYGHAVLDLLLSAQDGQILLAHPVRVTYRPDNTIYVDRANNAKSVREWARRGQRYVRVDDTAVWRDLYTTFGHNDAHWHDKPWRYGPMDEDFLKEERALVKRILFQGQEEAKKVKEEALRPFRDLWDRVSAEPDRSAPLKPLPSMEVVVDVAVVIVDPNFYLEEERLLRSTTRRRGGLME